MTSQQTGTVADWRKLAQRQYSKGPWFAPVRQLRRSFNRTGNWSGAADPTQSLPRIKHGGTFLMHHYSDKKG